MNEQEMCVVGKKPQILIDIYDKIIYNTTYHFRKGTDLK